MSIQEQVGARIRRVRKARGMTQQALADAIHKSKSVLSKYELGQATMDLPTLFEVAAALETGVDTLLDTAQPAAHPAVASGRSGVFRGDKLYLALWVGELWRGLVTLKDQPDGSVLAHLYIQTADFTDYNTCRAIYRGSLVCHPTNAVLVLTNLTDAADIITISTGVYRGTQNLCPGLLTQFSYVTSLPAATPVLLSAIPFNSEEKLCRALTPDKNDLTNLKRANLISAKSYLKDSMVFDQ